MIRQLQRGNAQSLDRPPDRTKPPVDIEARFSEAVSLLADIEARYLPIVTNERFAHDRPYLINRFERLRDDIRTLIDRYRSSAAPSNRQLWRLYFALTHSDVLPLLRQTHREFEQWLDQIGLPPGRTLEEQLSEWDVFHTIPRRGTLAERLHSVFAAAARGRYPVRFRHIRALIAGASPGERQAAASDEELLEAAREWMAPPGHVVPEGELPNDFPDYVVALNVREPGSVVPYAEAQVDGAIRRVLGMWTGQPVSRGVTVIGHVVVLKTRNLRTVQGRYALSLPGSGQVNAFTEEGTIFLSATTGEPSTIVHEGIHLYAKGTFRGVFGDHFDEGVTEYFARKVSTQVFNDPRTTKYVVQHDFAQAVIAVLGEDEVARAYFEGDLAPAHSAFVTVRQSLGDAQPESSWATFLEKLKAGSVTGSERPAAWCEAERLLSHI